MDETKLKSEYQEMFTKFLMGNFIVTDILADQVMDESIKLKSLWECKLAKEVQNSFYY